MRLDRLLWLVCGMLLGFALIPMVVMMVQVLVALLPWIMGGIALGAILYAAWR